ncbi:Bud site selection protein 6 [Dipsacomyces acuminosporus]|nr:Bud site selection protein 6 [Dipsacomyces acuminosporus]
MNRGYANHRMLSGMAARSPEPNDYSSANPGTERTAQKMWQQQQQHQNQQQQAPPSRGYNTAYGGVGNGSLRSTRSSGGAYARNDHNSAVSRMPYSSAQRNAHGVPYDGNTSSSAFDNSDAYASQSHFQPYVPDVEERRAAEHSSGTRTIDYSYTASNRPGSSHATAPLQVTTSYPDSDYTQRTASMRRYKVHDTSDSSQAFSSDSARPSAGGGGNASGEQSPNLDYSERHIVGNARLLSGRVNAAPITRPMEMSKSPGLNRLPSQRVEFGYTAPMKSTFAQSESPENDEIADIIADMSRTRISPANISALDLDSPAGDKRSEKHVYLQLGDDLKRVSLTDQPTQTTLINLFIEKYRERLAEESDVLPSIYIKDSDTGVFYELEDTSEVVNGSVLSWRTKPLNSVEAEARVAGESTADGPKASPNPEIESLAAMVKSLAETVSLLPAQFKNELAEAIKEVKTHTDEAIRSARSQAQRQSTDVAMKEDADQGSGPESRAIARSASLPPHSADELDAVRRRLEKAEVALSVERQARREAEEKANAEKEELVAAMEKLGKDVSSHPNILRVRIEEGKRMLKDEYRALNSRFEDTHTMVQEMRKDVTQRGSIPSAHMLRKASGELKSIDAGTNKLIKFINDTRADWKLTWEEELQNILKEQSFVKDVEQMLGELLDDTQHLEDVLGKLDQVVDLKVKERSRDSYVPAAATKFLDVVSADDAREAKQDFLMQITCVDVDHERRLGALKAAEKLRQQELATKVDEFEAELADFVGQRRLRKTGGTEELERRRAEKEVEVMKDMLKSVEEAERARRAKIAQRKAGKKAAS